MKLQRQETIRWKQKDFITLGRAVANFNKKINELNKEEEKLYLPKNLEYKIVKQGITTRKELQRVLKSLKRFLKEGAEELYTTKAGEQITKWEKKELTIETRKATRRLNQELKELYTIKDKNGYTKAQMGSQRLNELEDQLKNINQIENVKGYDFTRLRNRIHRIGTDDYVMKMSIVYQENVMDNLKELSENKSEFKKVYDYFEKIKNPIEFFNTMQRSTALQDFFVWYETPENYANFKTPEDLADYIIAQYKDETNQSEEEIKEEKNRIEEKKYKYSLVASTGVIVAQDDDISILRRMQFTSQFKPITNGYIIENK